MIKHFLTVFKSWYNFLNGKYTFCTHLIESLQKRIFKGKQKKKQYELRVVIVTGASSGIGAAAAKLFAIEKAKVVMVGRNTDKLGNVASEIKRTTGRDPLMIKADVSNEEEAKSVVDKTIEHFKKLDVLVNNAGIIGFNSVTDDRYMTEFDRIVTTNLRAVAVITHAAVPHLVKTRGNIVNISSIASTRALVNLSHYCASKAALDHFSRCIALELAPKGVRVNVVNPGPTMTDLAMTFGITREQSDEMYKKSAESSPLKMVSESGEIGDMILFLASDRAKSVTGALYTVDCGNNLVGRVQ